MAECSTTSDCIFKPDAKRRRLSLSQKKKVGFAERFQKVPSPEIEKANMNTSSSTPNAKTEQGHNSRHGYTSKDTARTARTWQLFETYKDY